MRTKSESNSRTHLETIPRRGAVSLSSLTSAAVLLTVFGWHVSGYAQALTAEEQLVLSKAQVNLAIQHHREKNQKLPFEIDPQLASQMTAKVEKILSENVTSENLQNGDFRQSGVDRSSVKDVRLTSWNISYGTKLEALQNLMGAATLSNCEEAQNRYTKETCALGETDIFVLNEADKGVCRSGNKFVARELAKTLKMNYAYAPEFFEAEPLYHGLLEEGPAECLSPSEADGMDHSNLTGNAILSRFPMTNVRQLALPKGPVENGYCWDWQRDEQNNPTIVDKTLSYLIGRRLFHSDDDRRELRYGGRNALMADIHLPDGKIVTVVATHLENKASGTCRKLQMETIVDSMKNNPYPYFLAGDMNSSSLDGSRKGVLATALKIGLSQTIQSPKFVTSIAGAAAPSGILLEFNTAKFFVWAATTLRNPSVKSIFFLRPNEDWEMFSVLEKAGFDWKGDADATLDGRNDGSWSTTNSRPSGFFHLHLNLEPTHFFPVSYGPFGPMKLDWIFFKNTGDSGLAARFPRTLNAIRKKMIKDVKKQGASELEVAEAFPSDHTPVTVLLQPR